MFIKGHIEQSPSERTAAKLSVVLVVLAVALWSAPALANEDANLAAQAGVSAEPAGAAVASQPGTVLPAPRTRAEARERIAAVDPADWLARFGPVERRAVPDAP